MSYSTRTAQYCKAIYDYRIILYQGKICAIYPSYITLSSKSNRVIAVCTSEGRIIIIICYNVWLIYETDTIL